MQCIGMFVLYYSASCSNLILFLLLVAKLLLSDFWVNRILFNQLHRAPGFTRCHEHKTADKILLKLPCKTLPSCSHWMRLLRERIFVNETCSKRDSFLQNWIMPCLIWEPFQPQIGYHQIQNASIPSSFAFGPNQKQENKMTVQDKSQGHMCAESLKAIITYNWPSALTCPHHYCSLGSQ